MRVSFLRWEKQAVLALFDLMSLMLLAAVLLAALPGKAYAYVDPSVMTYTIQALAGVAVALSAVLGVALRRTRKVLFRMLDIDENAGKEVDPQWKRAHKVGSDDEFADLIRSTSGIKDAAGRPGQDKCKNAESQADLPWKKKFLLLFAVLLFAGFTVGFVAPMEIVAGSSESLLFGISDVWYVMAVPVFVVVLSASCLLALTRGKVFDSLLLLFFCGGLCCYIQALLLNVGLPAADGGAVEWRNHTTMMVVSSLVWLALLLSPIVLLKFDRRRTRILASFVSLCLICVQAVGVLSLFLSADEYKTAEGEILVTEEGLFEVSGESNVIVFVLDCFDTAMLNEILPDEPDLLDDFTGFTYYQNSVGMMVPTMYAIPYLMTGEEPQEGETFSTYESERYLRSSFIEDISSNGYSVGIYTDALGLDCLTSDEIKREVSNHTVNVHQVESFGIDEVDTFRVLAKCALYRDMPWVLKWRFWFYTDEVNQRVVEYDTDGSPENTVYMIDDPRYYETLQGRGLSIESGDYKGAFRFIHLNGPHRPFTMNEEGIDVGLDNVTRSQQAIGSLHIVSTYIQQLKDMGLYDEATIIVTSDHGDWESSTELPDFAISPIMLVKPSFDEGGGDAPVQYSTAPVSHADFRATVLGAMSGNAEQYGPSIYDIPNGDRPRTTYMVTSDGSYAIDILEYKVDGDVLDFSTWSYTGMSWAVDE